MHHHRMSDVARFALAVGVVSYGGYFWLSILGNPISGASDYSLALPWSLAWDRGVPPYGSSFFTGLAIAANVSLGFVYVWLLDWMFQAPSDADDLQRRQLDRQSSQIGG